MFKAVVVVYALVLAVVTVNGCGKAQIEQLNTQVAALQSENAGLKAKVGELEKARNDAQTQVASLGAERDQAKKDLEECKSPDKGAEKASAQVKTGKGGNGKTAQAAADAGKSGKDKPKPGGAGKGKTKFSVPDKAK
jgi:septal ring factor EnvC (AmiA/AmiB activator)